MRNSATWPLNSSHWHQHTHSVSFMHLILVSWDLSILSFRTQGSNPVLHLVMVYGPSVLLHHRTVPPSWLNFHNIHLTIQKVTDHMNFRVSANQNSCDVSSLFDSDFSLGARMSQAVLHTFSQCPKRTFVLLLVLCSPITSRFIQMVSSFCNDMAA